MSRFYTDNEEFETGLRPTLTQQNDFVEEDPELMQPEGSSFERAVARGTDNLQASLYGFTKAVGDFLDIDVLSKFGEEGVERNIKEILANPADVKDWEDVDSLADFGTYFVEAIGEQVPQLLIDAPLAVAALGTGGGSGAALVSRRAGMAAIGKAAKRRLGHAAFLKFRDAAPALLGANLYAQSAGETQLEFMAEGIDDPGQALLTGIPKAILDRYGMEKILGASKHLGVKPESLLGGATQLVKAAGIGTVAEGMTEATQTAIDKLSIKAELGEEYELFSASNLKEIREAAIKGALVGGTLSATGETLQLYHEYAKSKKERLSGDVDILKEFLSPAAIGPTGTNVSEQESDKEIDLPEGVSLENDAPIPEPQSQIDAQARALIDPQSAKEVMEITRGSPFPSDGILPDDTFLVETENGYALTRRQDYAQQIIDTGGSQALMGELLFGNPNGKLDSDGTTVVGRDAQGEIVFEELTNPERMSDSIFNARAVVPNGKVEITDAQTAINERIQKVMDEFMTPEVVKAATAKADGDAQALEKIQGDLETVINRLDSNQRVALRQALTSPNSNLVAQQLVDLTQADLKSQSKSEQENPLVAERSLEESPEFFDDEAKRTAQREEAPQAEGLKPGVPVPEEKADKFDSKSTRISVPGRLHGRADNKFSSQKKAEAYAKKLNRYFKERGVSQRFDLERHPDGTVKYELKRSSPKARPRPIYRLQVEDRKQVDKKKDEFQFFDDAIAKSQKTGEQLSNTSNAKKATFSAVNIDTGELQQFHTMDLTTAGMDIQALLDAGIEGREGLILDGFHSALARMTEMGWVPGGDTPIINENGDIRRDAIIYHQTNFKSGVSKEKPLRYWEALAKAKNKKPTRKTINPDFEEKLLVEDEVTAEPANTPAKETPSSVELPEGKPEFRKQRTKSADNVFGYGIEESELELAAVIVKDLDLRPEFHVIDGSTENLEKAFQHNLLTAMDRWKIQEAFKANKKGVFIPQGRKGVVVLKPSKQPRHWTMAHELGHAAKLSAWDNLSQDNKQRLERMYRKDINNDASYQQPGGFDEWFSDQLANYVGEKVRTGSWSDRFFKKLADKLKSVFDKVAAFAAGTGNKRLLAQPEFAEIIKELKSEKVFQSNPFLRGDERYYFSNPLGLSTRASETFTRETQRMKRFFQTGWGNKTIRPFITGDEELRLMGPVGKKIADLFYWPANTNKTFTKPAYFSQLHSNRAVWFHALHELDKKYSPEELKTAFDELAVEDPKGRAAKDIRKFLDKFYKDFIQPTMPLVGYEKNYMPRYYEVAKIELNRVEFERVLAKYGVKNPTNVAKKILAGDGVAELPKFTDATGPSARLQHERQFRDPELIKELVEKGFLNSNPIETLDAYLNNAVQRGTYENIISGYRFPPGYKLKEGLSPRNKEKLQEYIELHDLKTLENAIKKGFVKEEGGEYKIYDANMALNKLVLDGLENQTLTSEQALRAHQIINGYMGKLGLEMPAQLNHAQSIAMMLTNWMVLSLSAVSSIVEIANIVKAGQDLEGFRMFKGALADYVKDKDALITAYEDMALVERKSQMDFLSQMYGYNNASVIAKKGNDLLFKINGQQWFTNFTRLISARMGEQFIHHHAKIINEKLPGAEDSKRYLNNLGVTASEVRKWNELGSPKLSVDYLDHEQSDLINKMTNALHRFVDSAVMRPNRAERPVWGNDLRFAMLMHLKTFAYSLFEHVIKAPLREAKARGLSDGTKYLLAVWSVFFAFAALGNEIREEIQYRLGGQYRPSNNMDWDKYLVHLAENRVGLTSRIDPWMELITNSHHATLAPFSFVPTASKIDQILRNDTPEEMAMDATPFLSQNPGAQWSIKRFLKE